MTADFHEIEFKLFKIELWKTGNPALFFSFLEHFQSYFLVTVTIFENKYGYFSRYFILNVFEGLNSKKCQCDNSRAILAPVHQGVLLLDEWTDTSGAWQCNERLMLFNGQYLQNLTSKDVLSYSVKC